MERGSLLPLSLRELAPAALSPEDFRPRVQALPWYLSPCPTQGGAYRRRDSAAPPARGMVGSGSG